MTNAPKNKSMRDTRLKDNLRANLQKRKNQARARTGPIKPGNNDQAENKE